jgi:hypothetical protein
MKVRETLISSFVIAPPGVIVDSDFMDRRYYERFRDLQRAVPEIFGLKSSRLRIRTVSNESGLVKQLYLEEIPQIPLPLHERRSTKNVVNDSYVQEIERIRKAIHDSSVKDHLACSPSLDPIGDIDSQFRRTRLRKNRRNEELFTYLANENPIPLPNHLPRVQPRALCVSITAQVKVLHKSYAEIKILEIQDDSLDPIFCKHLLKMQIDLKQVGRHRNLETGTTLLKAVYTSQPLAMTTRLAVSWATGEPAFLELVEITQ